MTLTDRVAIAALILICGAIVIAVVYYAWSGVTYLWGLLL
jgi:hypothetical protein